MDDIEIETILSYFDEELCQFIDAIGEIPYIAMPLEKPYVICLSGKIKNLCGYDADEILADREHWENIIHQCDRERVFKVFTRCKNEGLPFNIGYRIVHKDRSVRYVNDKGEPVFNDEGEVIQIEGIITPLEEIKKPESYLLSEFRKTKTLKNVKSKYFQEA